MLKSPGDEERLTREIIDLATEYGRYGYRRITALLNAVGWNVNHKRVERIWRREGLKVPQKQPKRGRLWLNDGSCIRLRPEHRNHVWAYDFVSCRTHDGRPVKLITVIDEFSRECLAVRAGRKMRSDHVLELLTELFTLKGVPEHIRSDNGTEFIAQKIQQWLKESQIKTLYIDPGSPWQNGYIEPCGCTGLANQKGGLIRRYSLMKQLRDQGWPVMALDLGNLVAQVRQQVGLAAL